MLFPARFRPRADRPDVFRDASPPRLDYLRANADSVLLSATMRTTPDCDAVGFVWLVSADSREAAERICKDDPFYTAGLGTPFELHQGPARCDGDHLTGRTNSRHALRRRREP